MKSNFDFLRDDFPVLYKQGSMAERYLYTDPNSCLIKIGLMGETIIKLMFDYDNVELPYTNDAIHRIDTLYREDLLDREMTSLFHSVRKMRNRAIHEALDNLDTCKQYLPVIHSLSLWFEEVYGSVDFNADSVSFVMPVEEAEPPQAAEAVEAGKAEADGDAQDKQLLAKAQSRAQTAAAMDRSQRQEQVHRAAAKRPKTEAETRVLIDEQLREAGWEADTINLRYSKGTRPQKGRNIAIAEWPTTSRAGNKGLADYALFKGLQLVGIIEAKAIHKDVSTVIDYQGKDYPKHIRPEDEQYVIDTWGEYKVPFTFATNGRPYLEQLRTKSGIWFLDLRDKANVPRPLRGWISPIGIADMLERDVVAGNDALRTMSKNVLRDPDGLNLRYYQIEAIEAAEKAVLSGATTCLLAMATGTGKTRTVLGMIYRFLKTNRFTRILFLVDRNSLGLQAHDVFKDVKLEELMPLEAIYNIKGLEDKLIDKETRVQVATVQGMVQRILYNGGDQKPAVSDFDLIIIDEAHRGYTLDKMMTEEEFAFRDQRDFQSKYRAVVDYFDGVKIALTATPAIHTTQIFGEPVYTYSYREAVVDGYLVDHDAPHNIVTKLSEEGIKYHKGESAAIYDPVTGEITNVESLADELDFDVDDFNRSIISESFNRTVLTEVCRDIDPTDPMGGKTLIYAVNDHHADMIVDTLKNIYGEMDVDNDAIMKITGSIENGNQKKIQQAIQKFKTEQYPNIVVTVDLLTTGIDVPAITRLVFMRRVKSRILFEQMLGRATRLCPEIQKDHFDIYDAVKIYEAIESNMKPVTSNPSITLTALVDSLKETEDSEPRVVQYQVNQILAKLHRKAARITNDKEEQFISMTGGYKVEEYAKMLKSMSPSAVRHKLLEDRDVFVELEKHTGLTYVNPVIVDSHEDELREHSRGYGRARNPGDYIEEFTQFVKNNMNQVAALNIICTRPADLTRESLKELRLMMNREGFTIKQLNTAISSMNNEEIVADLISLVRRFALGSPLISHRDKVDNAIKRLMKAHNFTAIQKKWINMIGAYLQNEPVLNKATFDQDQRFKNQGGFRKIDKLLNNELESLIKELNGYMYDDGGESA
ncbi:type I restriction-modification system endonuclease [uncultured Anaerovibrio sp.]|uniref:type I restriction-modification system endonuclease n=1 Tax=uncultured Anaerovibrio sp. TaxID=361586 RepID=UPI002627A6FA|nr:type I restriction-modification system endonuclease [uncultured Anaerovibrio sp.]